MPGDQPGRAEGQSGSAARRSHNRAVLSPLPVASQRPSGLKARAWIHLSWPLKGRGSAVGPATPRSHSRTVLSVLSLAESPPPVASQRPDRAEGQRIDLILVAAQDDRVGGRVESAYNPQPGGLILAACCQRTSVRAKGQAVDLIFMTTQDAWSCSRITSRAGPTTGRFCPRYQWPASRPSGLKARVLTHDAWPRNTTGLAVGSAACKSHSLAVLSPLPVASQRPSGAKSQRVDPVLMIAQHLRLGSRIGGA